MLKDHSIQRKLMGFIFITSVSVLLVSYLVLLSFEIRSYKQATARNLATVADIIASNSTAALIYDDAKLAREILAGLRADPDVDEAVLFNDKGARYATYPAGVDQAKLPQSPGKDGLDFRLRELRLYQPVIQGENRVGTLFLRSNLAGMYQRLGVYSLVLLGVLAGSAALAFFLSTFFQRRISQPILDLAETAKIVSLRRDYSVRARHTSKDELGFLTSAFNAMLEQIQLNHAALQESDDRFRRIADSAPVLIWLADPNKARTWFSKPWLTFVGRTLDQELNDGWKDNLHPDDRERFANAYVASFDSRQEFRIEYRLRRYDGEYRWLLSHGVPRYQGGYFAGYIGCCVDIHDRRVAEAAVRVSELQMRLVTDHASVLLAHVDHSYKFKFVNLAYASRYGRTPEEVTGRHIAEIVGRGPFERTRPLLESTLAGNREEFEVELPYAELGNRWVHFVLVPERDLEGKVVGFVAALTDTTQRRLAENELKRARDEAVAASRAKDDFLAALSHELRTPLSPVLLLASDAATNPELPAPVREDFETIRKNVELEARLIDDLLDLTRITRGKLVLELQAVDAHAVVNDALTTVHAELESKGITLVLQLDADRAPPPQVWGDPVRLQQVFWNVLKNAVKFTPAGGTITIVGERRRDTFVTRVADTGIGMTAEELDRVFEAFSQGDHAGSGGSHRFGGLGLGLAISRKVVELHAGRISVVSEGRNRGCTFSIELPLVAATVAKEPGSRGIAELSPPRPVNSTAVAGSGSALPLLLVEDHGPTRTTLENLLRRRGYRVVTATTVAEAREAAEREPIALVVSDIGLPDGNGYELMEELGKRYGVKGIALTGYGMESDITRSQTAGFVAHLIKPVRVQALDDALAAISNRAGSPSR